MGEGYQNNPWIIETFTPTIYTENGFSMKSWGIINGIRIGNFVVISVSGIMSANTTTADTNALNIPYKVRKQIVAIGMQSGGKAIFTRTDPLANNTSNVAIGAVSANDAIFFSVIAPIE